MRAGLENISGEEFFREEQSRFIEPQSKEQGDFQQIESSVGRLAIHKQDRTISVVAENPLDTYITKVAFRQLKDMPRKELSKEMTVRFKGAAGATLDDFGLASVSQELFLKRVQAAAEAMSLVIAMERQDKRSRAIWEAAKVSFKALLERIQRARLE